MRIRLARSTAEAQIYMQLHPCGTCGNRSAPPERTGVSFEGGPAIRYAGPCSGCGREREFTFRVPGGADRPADAADPEPSPDPDRPTGGVFGGPHPSELLDPGQWAWLAESLGSGIPAEPDQLAAPEHAPARADLLLAAAAMGEALRFVPAGADEVPAEAFRSELGREVYVRDPGQFRRIRLESARQTYLQIADRYGQSPNRSAMSS